MRTLRPPRLVAAHAIALFLVVFATIASARPAAAQEEQVTLASRRPGITERVLLTPPNGAPVASLILFTGGNGLLYSRDGTRLAGGGNNFLIRSRQKFADAGFLVAAIDVPSDKTAGLAGFRSTPEHAEDVAALIAELRRRAPVPVWLVGTSMGTISAANAAAQLKSGGADGLVLTSTIVVQSRMVAPIEAVVALDQIALPTLFVHNKDDACPLCNFDAVAGVMARLTQAPKKELIAVSGGAPPQSEPCEALSRHGYIGIEDEVVGDIARWIKGDG